MAVDTGYLTTQVNNIVAQLHGIYDEIGVPARERESREAELFSALSETLNNHLKVVDEEREDMTQEAERLITAIQQMESSLSDERANGQYELNRDDLRVTYPLNKCIAFLREKNDAMSKLHRERYEQVKKLVDALESYSSHLEPSFVKLELPPTAPGSSIPPSFDLSPLYVTALDAEFTHVYEEYHRRIAQVQSACEEMIKLWAELGTPQAQTDSTIVKCYRESPEQLGLHEDDVANLMAKRNKLVEEKKGRERKINDLRSTVISLWDRFGVEEADRKAFLAANRGCGLRTINDLEEELTRLNELKRQNLHLFVEDARCRLQELWDALFFSEEEMLDFTPAFSDVCSDALLEAHEAEITRLEAIKEQRAPTLEMIERHRTLLTDREALATSSQDASRLMGRGNKGEKRDPGKLLREEKLRKRIAKELPKLEADLRKELEHWEDEFGRPFLVHGERYLDALTPVKSMLPPRSKTPSGATSRAGATSPSKLPARVPLGNMPHGNNSPERRMQPGAYSSSTLNGKMPPPRGPPPRMRALTVESREDRFSHLMEPPRCNSAMSSAYVRPVSPEDVYDDRQRSFMSASGFSNSQRSTGFSHSSHSSQSSLSLNSSSQAFPRPNPYLQHAAPPPAARQVSNSSTVNTATSGSENWETFEDGSGSEADPSDIYYSKLRAAHGGKRFAPEDGADLTGKKAKGIRSVSPDGPHPGQVLRVAGSDNEWADDYETY
ncbi:Microtubule-associated protein MAP65/Ase1/PRC1 [Penicillium crustosum]|uniref:Microtubule-associated protein MAP65/Ase1/PRC1 n=1 Tax=Penicillium crustosum TaxID=36656 RepID=UPI002385686A|nr:Microtubule-associated protein MAP65/Ase1/PRC1 [Penicillium crustosum]KAJ5411317.1 Microtubule-associated protein MAP65/Ase1/PRC1 [Penicillium crustosum]